MIGKYVLSANQTLMKEGLHSEVNPHLNLSGQLQENQLYADICVCE